MIAISIMAMIVGTLGALARGVQEGYTYTEGHGTATQHARVALERITASVREATASPEFPGALVVTTVVVVPVKSRPGLPDKWVEYKFPDTLVVWHPERNPANPDGKPVDAEGNPRSRPQFSELVIYCPDPDKPNELVEITFPNGDSRPVAPASDEAWWEAEIGSLKEKFASLKKSGNLDSAMLTNLLRIAQVRGTRGSAWFGVRLRPSAAEWNEYVDKKKSGEEDLWPDLAWVQGFHGTEAGLAQTWVRMELQLIPGDRAASDPDGATSPVPFFGSAALYYELKRETP